MLGLRIVDESDDVDKLDFWELIRDCKWCGDVLDRKERRDAAFDREERSIGGGRTIDLTKDQEQ